MYKIKRVADADTMSKPPGRRADALTQELRARLVQGGTYRLQLHGTTHTEILKEIEALRQRVFHAGRVTGRKCRTYTTSERDGDFFYFEGQAK